MELLVALGANVLIGLVLLVLFARRQPQALRTLRDADETLRIYRRHFSDARGTVISSADGDSAILVLQGGGIGLLQRHGLRWNARQLAPGEVRAVIEAGDLLKVRLHDFGWPTCRIRVTDSHARSDLSAKLRALASEHPALSVASPHA